MSINNAIQKWSHASPYKVSDRKSGLSRTLANLKSLLSSLGLGRNSAGFGQRLVKITVDTKQAKNVPDGPDTTKESTESQRSGGDRFIGQSRSWSIDLGSPKKNIRQGENGILNQDQGACKTKLNRISPLYETTEQSKHLQ